MGLLTPAFVRCLEDLDPDLPSMLNHPILAVLSAIALGVTFVNVVSALQCFPP